jgi:elongation factor P hydroxylase
MGESMKHTPGKWAVKGGTKVRKSQRGYWFCPYCKKSVDSMCVTFEEIHDSCGHPVAWIDPDNVLQEALDEIAKQFIERDDELIILTKAQGHSVMFEISRIKVKNNRLREALQSLYDQQNGAPLERDRDEWQEAIKMAEKALREGD